MQIRTKPEPMNLSVLLTRLRERRLEYGQKQGYILVNPIEFNLYANIFGNMGNSNLVIPHNGRKSLTYNGIELRAT